MIYKSDKRRHIGNEAPNTWRTLSGDEWMYIFYYRPNPQSLFAIGNINGTVVLPDNWTTPVGINFVNNILLHKNIHYHTPHFQT